MNLASHRVTQMSSVHESYICSRFCFITICIETTRNLLLLFFRLLYLPAACAAVARSWLSWSCVPDLQVRAQVSFALLFDLIIKVVSVAKTECMPRISFSFFLSFSSSVFTFRLWNSLRWLKFRGIRMWAWRARARSLRDRFVEYVINYRWW